ncbi:MAG: hypothetical protein AB1414_16875 [bacterium]
MMKKKWHPYFSNILKYLLEPKGFTVETEVEVGKMPLRIDIVVIRKGKDADVKSLPLVFQSFTDYNVIEYKSPGDRFTGNDFDRLFAYVLLFKIKEGIQWRRQINVYAFISGGIKGIESYIRRNGHELAMIKDGFYFADFGFNFYLIQLDKLEMINENYGLILFTSGDKIKELVKEIGSKGDSVSKLDLLELFETGLYLHPEEFKEEVKLMPQTLADRPDIIGELADIVGVDKFIQGIGKERLLRSLGEEEVKLMPKTLADRPDIMRELVDIVGIDKFVEGIGEEKVIRSIGEKKVIRSIGEKEVIRSIGEKEVIRSIGEKEVIRNIGEKEVIRTIGEENLLKDLIHLLGKEKIKKMLKEN